MHFFCLPPPLSFPWVEGSSFGNEGGSTDEELLERALAGDEPAFETLVRRYHQALSRFLRLFVTDPLKAEDAAQDTWIALLGGSAHFEGRSAFRTWLFGVGANRARDLSRKEGRDEARVREWVQQFEEERSAVPVSRFLPSTHPEYPEHWGELPRPRAIHFPQESPERRLFQREAAALIARELDRLPASMAAVVTLRDFAGTSAEEAARILDINPAHQRVLLHRGRIRLWQVWEEYQAGEE